MRKLICFCVCAGASFNPYSLALTGNGMENTVQNTTWNYNSEEAPCGKEIIGAYNGSNINTEFLIRYKQGGWERTRDLNAYHGQGIRSASAPDAWIELPGLDFEKKISIFGDFTKEELEQKLKEFDK